jgi:single-strand DNA-binding protein
MADMKLVRVNRVHLSGRVTKDLILRYAPDGTPVAAFTLAFNRWVREAGGEWKEIPSFLRILATGPLAERCGTQLHKGSPLYLEGRLQTRRYKRRDGEMRDLVEIRADAIQFLEREGEAPEEEARAGAPAAAARPAGRAGVEEGELFPEIDSGEEEI